MLPVFLGKIHLKDVEDLPWVANWKPDYILSLKLNFLPVVKSGDHVSDGPVTRYGLAPFFFIPDSD